MSVVNIAKESLADFFAGNGTVGTAPAQLIGMALELKKHVVVGADSTNTNTVTVGSSSAQAGNGFVLRAGEKTPLIFVDDASKVWVVGGASGQKYNWVGS